MSSIGQQLKQAREARGLIIKQVVQATRIRAHYLEAMEADDFSSMPSAAQARGFLRSYANFLELNADELINQQRSGASPTAEFITPHQSALIPAPSPVSADPAPEPPVETISHVLKPELEPTIQEPEADPHEDEEPQAISVVETPKALSESQLIFVEIGTRLRQRRELLSLTLDEIERHTHVRKHYLEIIEGGRFDELPSPVQARGMLSNYSAFLDMDTEATLLRFADALQARRLERQSSLPQTTSSRRRIAFPSWLRRLMSPDLIFGGGMIILLFTLTIWWTGRVFSNENNQSAQAPSISDVLLASPAAGTTEAEAEATRSTDLLPTDVAVSSIDDEDTPTPTETIPADGSGVQITISVLERTFVRVTVDGNVELDGRVVPGFAQTFNGAERVEVLTGSGSAIQIIFNQRNLGPMGNLGQVVDLIYTIAGPQTPTMTPSSTPTATPRFQRTITPTPTLTPTRTETVTLTPTLPPSPTP
jgi:cytoskeletal protein RodZ